MTTYPANIGFQLDEPRRSRVLQAAERLGLAVRHVDTGFIVIVPDPRTAYALGRASADDDDSEGCDV
jgi:hypothetical protein